MSFPRRPNALPAALALWLSSLGAQAHLGGAESSVQADTSQWQASVTLVHQAKFAVYTQTTPDGVVVRQYVAPGGGVFAVAWEGPVLPDLETLLGVQFGAYRDALQARRRGVRIDTPNLFLESGGMMRAFVGRAYLPTKLPPGVVAGDLL